MRSSSSSMLSRFRRLACCRSNSRMTRLLAASCQASASSSAGWCCISRAMSSSWISVSPTYTGGNWFLGLPASPTGIICMLLLQKDSLPRTARTFTDKDEQELASNHSCPCESEPSVAASVSGAFANHLVLPAEILHRHAEHVHQSGEREEYEDGQAQEDVGFVDPVHIRNVTSHAALQGQYALCPGRELEHFGAIQVPHGGQDGGQAEGDLHHQDDDDQVVCNGAAGTNSWVGQAAVGEHGAADQAHDAGDAADHHGHDLFLAWGHQPFIGPFRRQQANQVAEEDHQDTHMEQHAGQYHVFLSQHLAGMGFPGELTVVITRPGADEQDRQGDVRVYPENQCV